ncbi:fatty acid desaturase [Rhodophyticola sp. CCM32]|uniref:fatty acid desaturase n=1 Tax=Rhodophyticola sp. CCM32 TaxID=2916397 RepID=UPI00107F215E|nr:fatty acid desaturase [Rhodophyticola sp. CCM32]QBY02523.1 fatty acid desaturase [Rhodophyticola sp. CCM32]
MRVEWPTVLVIVLCYLGWCLALFLLPMIWLPLAIGLGAYTIALQSSLQHEVTHGHPFRARRLNEAIVFASLNLCIPFIRFRDMHLDHHLDSNLTDPYDDPESNYLDSAVWTRLPRPLRIILMANNTLIGRLLLGPVVSQTAFMIGDWRQVRSGDRGVLRAWLWHVATIMPVLILVLVAPMPLWAYLLACYMGIAVLKIRTFLEHRAHDRASGRTVIIEDQGPLAFLFLNNNFHVVHHMHPRLPWYQIPALYFSHKDRYLNRNDGYFYRSYAAIFRRHLFRPKDPVPHPLWSRTDL